MNDDFTYRRKDPLPLLSRGLRDPQTDWTALPRPGFDHRGNPLRPPTFISTPGGTHVGTTYAGCSTLHAPNGTTYRVDEQRNVRDDFGRSIGRIDMLGQLKPG